MTVPRVHIKGLEDSADKEEIRRLFGKFGPLKNVWIATRPPGFAYVFFETFKDAEKAVDYYNGKRVCGMTVRVELSPIEDKWRPRPHHPPPPPRRLHPPDRRRPDEMSDQSFSDASGSFYDSGPDSRGDFERRHDGYHGRSSRGGGMHYRDDFQSRGRPHSHHRGGGRHHSSRSRSYSNERYPERRGSVGRGGRAYNDGRGRYDEGEYRPRGRSREDYPGDSFQGRGHSKGGPPDRYHVPKHYDRDGGGRPREHRRHDNYSDAGRGHYPEKPYKRPHSSRHLPPPPPSRHAPPEFPPPKRRPIVDSEYVAKQYRMKHSKNGDFGESSRSGESRHRDLEYRHNRKMAKEEMYRMKERGYVPDEPKKESYNRHPGSHRRSHHAHSKYFESKEMRSRSPLSGSPLPSRYEYANNSPSPSRSRSRSASNQSSDTSRGPSATPSPPPHHLHIPSRSPSRSVSPLFQSEGYPSGGKYSPNSTKDDSNYRSPSPLHMETSKYTPSPPPPPPPVQNFERASSPTTFGLNSPVYLLPPKDEKDFDERYESEQQVEMERPKKHHEYKKMKREVHDRDCDRQISYQEKSGKRRYVDRHHDPIQDRDDKSLHSRPLSESFDLIGSSHSSEHLSPPPQRRSRADLKRRSSHKEEYVVQKNIV